MAKKIVRGITDVKTINNQDFDTNNVNDLLSDGQYNYIHRKKGKNEEYHNLTDNIKTISSDNTELLSVTNYNKTTNTATLHPKHDAQKEQVLESTRNTVTINHGTNGTAEKTSLDVNFEKVQAKLRAGDGINLSDNTISLLHVDETTVNCDNIITTQYLKPGLGSTNLPNGAEPYGILTVVRIGDVVEQTYQNYKGAGRYFRTCYQVTTNPNWTQWRDIVTNKEKMTSLLAQKQDTLVAGDGITIEGQTISASGATHTIQEFYTPGQFRVIKHVVTSELQSLITFVFYCFSDTAEHVITAELKQQLEPFVAPNFTISNGAISIARNAGEIKLINSAPSNEVYQQGIFTFYKNSGGGGTDV